MKDIILKTCCVVALAAALPMHASAQTPDNCLGINEVMQLAAANDPAVTTSEARRREARSQVEEAKSLYRPQISAFARTGVGDVGLIDSAIQNQVGLSASQRIIDFGDARLARKSARLSVQAGDQDIRLTEQQAATRAATAVLEMLRAQEAIAFTRDRQEYFRDQLSAIEAVLDSGGATVSERAEVAAQLSSAQAFLLDLKVQFDEAAIVLEIETGDSRAICAGSIVEAEFGTLAAEVENVDDVIFEALNEAPELQALEARSDSLAADSERQRRERLPIISVVGSAAYSSIGSGNFELQERVGLDVSVPLYAGNALRARSDGASARQAAQDVRIGYQRILSLRAQALTAQELEDLSRELFEFAKVEYDAGTRTLPDLVEVRVEYEQAGLQRIGIKFQLLTETLALLALSGKLA